MIGEKRSLIGVKKKRPSCVPFLASRMLCSFSPCLPLLFSSRSSLVSRRTNEQQQHQPKAQSTKSTARRNDPDMLEKTERRTNERKHTISKRLRGASET